MSDNAHLVDLALDRLLAITWKTDWGRSWSACSLLREHLRRIDLWRNALSLNRTLRPHVSGDAGSVYDLPSRIAPMPEEVRQKIDSVWEPHLEALRIKSLSKPPVKLSRTERRRSHGTLMADEGHSGVGFWVNADVEKYLHWCGVLDLPQVREVDLPCPYEPVIRLFERGGQYEMHHGWWKVMGISFQGHGSASPLLVLDDASLDEIDSAASRRTGDAP